MAGSTGGSGAFPDSHTKHHGKNADSAPGIDAIKRFVNKLYPNEVTHLQVTAVRKFWLGGPDPLDKILIFHREENVRTLTPAHYHYITCGFSDLHGDGRTHQFTGPGEQSGFGFELTFRLRAREGTQAPVWPARMLNSLARYVFKTGNMLNSGDHVPWQQPLDGGEESIIQHMMITEEREFGTLEAPHGDLEFRQVVGVTESEMLAAQNWKGKGVLDLMSKMSETGGALLVTDIDREHSLFEYNPDLRQTVTDSGHRDGTTLGHVTAACHWHGSTPQRLEEDEDEDEDEEVRHSQVEITIDSDAAEILPHVIRGRLMKGRFFVYQNVSNQVIIFIPPEFTADMVIVSRDEPIKSQGQVLQIYCDKDFSESMSKKLACCERPQELKKKLPRSFQFKNPSVILTVVPLGAIPVVAADN